MHAGGHRFDSDILHTKWEFEFEFEFERKFDERKFEISNAQADGRVDKVL